MHRETFRDTKPSPPKPRYRFDGDLPAALAHLRDKPRWVAWEYKLKGGKWDKPPVNPHTGRLASVGDPATWGTFVEALAAMRKYRLAGVGLVLVKGGDISGVDLDDCISEDGPSTLAAEIIAFAETYAEESPSGRGVRMFVSGDAPTLKDDSIGVEVYNSGRYLTITSEHIEGTPTEIKPAPRTLARLVAAVDAEREAKRAKRGKSNGARPNGKAQNGQARAGGSFFANVNAIALSRLDDWVPTLHPSAQKHATGAWRITSADLGRDLEEDLAYHPDGIRDHGEECGMTPIDAVQRHGPAGDDAVASAMWLCQRLGIEPASLGWRGAVNGASARERANGNGSAPPPHDEQPGGHAEENQPIPNVTAMNAASLVENRRPSGSTYV